MNIFSYISLVKIFMGIMPVEFTALSLYAASCIKGKSTDHPAFWLALVCLGILLSEIIRSFFMLTGELPQHPKNSALWLLELSFFGGFCYELGKRYLRKVWDRFFNSR